MYVDEQTWFEGHIREGMGIKEAAELAYEANAVALLIAERIEDGEIVDDAEGCIAIDNLIHSRNFLATFLEKPVSVAEGESKEAFMQRIIGMYQMRGGVQYV